MKKPAKPRRERSEARRAGRSPKPVTNTVFESASEADTALFGEVFARALHAGDILLLTGELGAGKTVFVRGLAKGLGIDPATVRSPTYLVAMTYSGKAPLLHVDLYRKEIPERDLIDEILTFSGIVAVEWGERLRPFLPPGTAIEIVFEMRGAGRILRVTGADDTA